jgi:hypothetical protein
VIDKEVATPAEQPDCPHRRPTRAGHDRPLDRLEQLRRRRLGSRRAAERPPNPQDDVVVRGGEQGVRAAVPLGRARARAHPAGNPRREAARRRIGHRRVLHAVGRRHPGVGGRASPPVRRLRGRRRRVARQGRALLRRLGSGSQLRARGGDRHRLRARARVARGPPRQPRVPQGGAQLQPARGDGRAHLHRAGRGARRARSARPRCRAPARRLRAPHRRGRHRHREA